MTAWLQTDMRATGEHRRGRCLEAPDVYLEALRPDHGLSCLSHHLLAEIQIITCPLMWAVVLIGSWWRKFRCHRSRRCQSLPRLSKEGKKANWGEWLILGGLLAENLDWLSCGHLQCLDLKEYFMSNLSPALLINTKIPLNFGFNVPA